MRRRPFPRPRPIVRVVLAFAVGGTFAAANAQENVEIVQGRFDVQGWIRNGAASVESTELDEDDVAAILDGRRETVARPGFATVGFRYTFTAPHGVRRVAVHFGDDRTYAVRLRVEEADGALFSAGERVVEGDTPALFRLVDVETLSLAFEVEALDADRIAIADVDVAGPLAILSISLHGVPATLPEGGSFPVEVFGRDRFGGRPEVTSFCRLVVEPDRALVLTGRSRAMTRVGGPIQITPRLGDLTGLMRSVLVSPLQPAPPAASVTSLARSVRGRLEGAPPFEVFRRDAGAREWSRRRIEWRASFVDATVEAGSAYHYSYRRVDALENPLSATSEETRVRVGANPPPGTVERGRTPILVVLLVDTFAPGEESGVREAISGAARFLFRHSRGGLALDPTFVPITQLTPLADDPVGAHLIADVDTRLRARGLRADAFPLVYVCGNGLAGEYGGFTVLGGALAAMGRSSSTPTPTSPFGADVAAAWSFAHEVMHLVDDVAARSNREDLPSCHPRENAVAGIGPADAGESWAGLAAVVASIDRWDELPIVFAHETVDTDGDGLADDDPFLPLDERRFGSAVDDPDGDGDGLDDLAEAAAGLYWGTDPTLADGDADGIPDGADPWPLSNFTGVIPAGNEPAPLASATAASGEVRHVAIAAAWRPDALTLELTSDAPCDFFLELDGSGADGRWCADVRVGDASDVWAGEARLAIRAHHAPTGVFVGSRRVEGARLVTTTDALGSVVRVELPRALGPGARDVVVAADAPTIDGLRLSPGTVLGLALVARPARPADPHPFEPFAAGEPWVSMFETHRMLDAVLVDD